MKNKFSDPENPSMAVVCATWRNPEKPSLARLYGIVSLVEQIDHQDYKGDAKIVIVDDSEEPHPFLEGLADQMDDKLLYIHVPSRNDVAQELKDQLPMALKFMPTDDELQNEPFWKRTVESARAWEKFFPFDYEFEKEIRMVAQMEQDRPTIGMKKNLGFQAVKDKWGEYPDIYVCADDDDHHSPDYLKIVADSMVEHDADFVKIEQSLIHTIDHDPKKQFWGELDLKLTEDVNGQWRVPDEVMESDAYQSQDGDLKTRKVHTLYNRNLMLAWPVISHDGAQHNYTSRQWRKAVKQFGGYMPTSFSEEIITFRNMRENFGKDFKPVAVRAEGEAPFLRCWDGRNESDFWATGVLEDKDVPKWAKDATQMLYTALSRPDDFDHETYLKKLGEEYGKTRQLPKHALDINETVPTATQAQAHKQPTRRPKPAGPR